MPFVRHSGEVKYVCRLSEWLQNGVDTETLNLAFSSLCKPFYFY